LPRNMRQSVAGTEPSGAGALLAPSVEIDRLIRDREVERRTDGPFDQTDFAAMGAHKLGSDGEA
jgi:hypothetical protein